MATSQKKIEANRRNALKAGRKKGKKNAVTLEREAVQKAIQEQIMQQAEVLVRSAMIPAKGMNFIYRIDEIKNKQGKVVGTKHRIVKNQEEIAMALDKMAEGGYDPDGEFYYVTTREPNHKAIQMLLDRALGKSKESIELSNPDGNLKNIIVIKNNDKKN